MTISFKLRENFALALSKIHSFYKEISLPVKMIYYFYFHRNRPLFSSHVLNFTFGKDLYVEVLFNASLNVLNRRFLE